MKKKKKVKLEKEKFDLSPSWLASARMTYKTLRARVTFSLRFLPAANGKCARG